jgi:hypothetical protein
MEMSAVCSVLTGTRSKTALWGLTQGWAFLAKPPVEQLLENFATLYCTVITRALHWSLSGARSIHSMQPQTTSPRFSFGGHCANFFLPGFGSSVSSWDLPVHAPPPPLLFWTRLLGTWCGILRCFVVFLSLAQKCQNFWHHLTISHKVVHTILPPCSSVHDTRSPVSYYVHYMGENVVHRH